jgi:tetratricopeptide (TPR) repeat protein
MSRWNRTPLFGILMLGLLASSAEAKTRLSGTVRDLEEKPVEGVKIEVISDYLKRTWSTTTDRKGEWAIMVDGREWKFVASKEGYHTVEDQKPLGALGNPRRPTLDFILAPARAGGQVAAPVAVAPQAQGTPVPQLDLSDLKAGNALFDEGRYPEAIASYQQALAKNPHLDQIHVAIADTYVKQGDWANAAVSYAKVPETDPIYGRALLGLANAQVRQQKYEQALDSYKKILATEPSHPDANYIVGQILFERGEAEEARRYLEAATQAKPDWAPPYVKLGYVHVNLGNDAQAKKAFETALALDPGNAEAKSMLEMFR